MKPVSRHVLPPQTERTFQAQVEQLATLHRWLYYHTYRSVHSVKGFPDLVLVRGARLIFAELKRDGKEPTPAQADWLDRLRFTSAEVYLWRPNDWKRIMEILT